jgi:hypothetical protein
MNPLRFAVTSAAFLLASQAVVAQPARERELAAAIAAEPREIRRYFDLADYYARDDRTGEADRVLRSALAAVDPLSRPVYERRILLYLDPFRPSLIGAIADEWLGVDGTSAVTALLSAGHRLRLASGARGDGTDLAEREVDLGLRVVDGALPANPDIAALRFVRSNLLQAKAALVSDPKLQRALIEEAQTAYRQAEHLRRASEGAPPVAAALAGVVAAMTRMPPFGPPGAVRAPELVPVPRVIKEARPRLTGRDDPFQRIDLEIVVGPDGSVTQVYAPQSIDGYNRSLADLVLESEYEPTTLHGQPVSVILRVTKPFRR